MMNYIWAFLIVASFISSIITGKVSDFSQALIQGGQDAVSLLLKLVSMLCLWGGIMEIAEQSGITKLLGKAMMPFLKRIFPTLKSEAYALEAISMNITANILGLGNAATPLGLEAMRRLQKLNSSSQTASDEMVVFVVMNSAAMHIIPTTVATLRAQYASENPMEILPASLLTSACALTVAVTVAKFLNRLSRRKCR